jgi:formylglycine-generating enzyme required for sulfatase activity
MKKFFLFLITCLAVIIVMASCSKSTEPGIDLPQEIEWCLIPAGEFTYGPPEEEVNYTSIENIDYDYEIMKYEITNGQYLAYLQEAYAAGDVWLSGSEVQGSYPGDVHWESGNYHFYQLGTPASWNYAQISYSNGKFILNVPSGFTVADYMNHPVVRITWFGAWHFAEYHGWRLPTEHEWEKGARGMTGYTFPWGNTLAGSRANYLNSGDPWDNGTSPVGFYNGQTYQDFQTSDMQSPFGVYDMAGNVFNWTDSWYGDSYPDSRVVRGGGWSVAYTYYLRSFTRNNFIPTNCHYDYGFRCVRIPE